MTVRLGSLCVVPFWSQSDNMNVDSNYVFLRVVLPEMVRQTEDTVFVVLFPDPKYGADRWVYQPDGFQTDRIRLYPWNYDTQMSSGVTGFDPVRFQRLEQEQGPGVYWLHQVESGTFMAGGYTHSYGGLSRPTLIAQHHYVIHRSLPYVYEANFPRQWLQIGGSMASDRVVYNSRYCKRMADEAFGEYLGDDRMNKLQEKSRVLPFGLLKGDEPLAPEATSDNPPIFLYNHRFENYKRPEITFGAFKTLRDEGFRFQVWATQTIGQKTGGLKTHFMDKIVYEPVRADYLNRVAVPAINTMNSMHETFCIAILDSLAMGHLVVLPDDLTFPELVPPHYPYLFKNPKEQLDMLRHILAHWPDDYNLWRVRLSEYVRQTFDLTEYCTNYLQLIQEAETVHWQVERKANTMDGLMKVFQSMQKGKLYPPQDLRRAMGNISGLQQQSCPTRRMVREAIALRDDVRVKWENGIRLMRE